MEYKKKELNKSMREVGLKIKIKTNHKSCFVLANEFESGLYFGVVLDTRVYVKFLNDKIFDSFEELINYIENLPKEEVDFINEYYEKKEN